MWHVWRYASQLLLAFLVLEATCTLAATSSDMIQLGMNKIARNAEIERLFVNYDAHIASNVVNDTETTIENETPFIQSVELLMDPNHPSAVESRIIASDGSHTIQVLVGGQMLELIIDTGSGKTAFICEGCHQCGSKHHDHPFKFTNNTIYLPCDTAHLGDGHDGSCMECHHGKCKYGQRYVEGDSWEAYKVSDMMAFSIHDPDFQAKVEFGCIYEQTGLFSAQPSDGIMGFSRHPDSIFEQFYRAGTTQSRLFAQCLADDGGVLTLGGVDMSVNTKPMAYTPLRDTGYQYWTVHLESVTIGTVDLGVSELEYNADRGCVFDSGTTFVYFPTTIKQSFITAWSNAMQQAGQDITPPIGDTYQSLSDTIASSLPNICFHFSNDVELCMPPTSYFYRINSNVYAGTIYFGDGGHATIVGASALMHHNVLYDQDHHRIGIAPADCAAASAAVAMAEDGQQIERVALELHPGGPTFETTFDKNYWSNWVLASVTFFAVAGLVHAVWTQVTEPLDGEIEKKTKLDESQKNETMVERRVPPAKDAVGLDPRPCESEEEAFAFVLMQE